MTRYEAYWNKNLFEHGMGEVVVARFREDGAVASSIFLIDAYCLGVKDVFALDEMDEAEFRELLGLHREKSPLDPLHPARARKLIEDAVAYAQSFGLLPCREYKKARRVFSGIDAKLCSDVFTFGKDGKPCLIPGPDDSEERIARVLQLLETHFGADGFTYILPVEDGVDDFEEDDDLFSDEIAKVNLDDVCEGTRDRLTDLLDKRQGTVPSFEEFSGAITAACCMPQPMAMDQVLSRVKMSGSEISLESFAEDAILYWGMVAALLENARMSPGDTCIDLAEDEYETREEFANALSLWASGFERVVNAFPEEWKGAFDTPETRYAWSLIRAWSNPGKPGNQELILASANLAPGTRLLPEAVVDLYCSLRKS